MTAYNTKHPYEPDWQIPRGVWANEELNYENITWGILLGSFYSGKTSGRHFNLTTLHGPTIAGPTIATKRFSPYSINVPINYSRANQIPIALSPTSKLITSRMPRTVTFEPFNPWSPPVDGWSTQSPKSYSPPRIAGD